jgi:hypothetical protein
LEAAVRGRKPLSNAAKLQRASRRPLNPAEPTLPAAGVEPPTDLTGDALAVWIEAVPELVRSGVLTVVDVGRTAHACRWEALGRRLLAEVDLVAGKRRAELIRLAATCHGLADRTWTALGVGDPRERHRMRTAPPERDDLAEFKRRHGA